MTSGEIRASFLEFFAKQGHQVVPSSPLVPLGDPTLLFTNAGMNQFKNVFLGNEVRDYSRATSSQKCVRAGGKHNDLENVGRTRRHHTFFEMLGNFSFGDYFKAEAIEHAWKLLTEDYGLDKERLWVTVFREDDEAAKLWKKISALPDHRIERMDEADNFWSMGETGPCGPCSEIHYDFGDGAGKGTSPADPGSDGDRFVEIWNLVFMEFDRSADGTMLRLPRPSIDTGMGLERISCALQGKLSSWETDLFTPLLDAIAELVGRPYERDTEAGFYFRVIADHLRASTFLIADNVFPSNEWRGYVLRRILRRAVSHAYFLGVREPRLHLLTDTVATNMAQAYPEIPERSEHIRRIIEAEEASFGRTLDRGIDNLQRWLERHSGAAVDGATAFKLSDTDGLPVDVIQEIAEKSGVAVDLEGFESHMEEQRTRSRAAAKSRSASMEGYTWNEIEAGSGDIFIGYDCSESSGKLLRHRTADDDRVWMIIDRTPFYAEAGGQVGDTGQLIGDDWTLDVEDTFSIENTLVHSGRLSGTLPQESTDVLARVDIERRSSIMRNHTGTHLLHSALRDILGEHVRQAGSLVDADRLRFDFTHYAQVSPEELRKIEDVVNRHVLSNHPVAHVETTYDDAIDAGAMALFGEKYGETVRMIQVGSGVSTELCGGLHCTGSGQIGPFVFVSESGIAAGVRRVEALTGTAALEFLRAARHSLDQVATTLKTSPADVAERASSLIVQNRELAREVEDLQVQLASGSSKNALEKQQWGGFEFVIGEVSGFSSVGAFREFSDQQRMSACGTIGTVIDDKPVVLSFSTPAALEAGLQAGTLARELGRIMGGGGGGKPHMAQSGGKDPKSIQAALARAREHWKDAAERTKGES